MKNLTKIMFVFIFLCSFSSCKKVEEDVFTNSTLPSNYTNQGTITIKSRNLKICIWDWSVVDGDKINLLINGKTVISNYELIDEKKCITIVLPVGENWIGVEALDEGSLGAASPHVEFDDGIKTQAFDILAYINEPGGYKIKVVL